MLTILEKPNAAPPPQGGYSPDQVMAMQRAVIRLFDHWDVSDTQAAVLMGGISAKTFQRWKKGEYGNPSRDQADRMSLILGIHKALRIIYTDAPRGYRWIGAANELFDGESALGIMLRGGIEDIRRIRTYLDSVRGGW
jgi:hypothetical protein